MKNVLIFFVLFAIAISASASFSPKPTEQEKDDSILITIVHEIEATVGETFEIKLKGNASTGYIWVFETDFDSDLVEFIEHKVILEEGNDLVGAPEMNVWVFKGLKEGQTYASLEYKRPWEEDVQPIRRFDYMVTILP